MIRSAPVAWRTFSSVVSEAISFSTRPRGVTSITASSVTIRLTTLRPVNGSVQRVRILWPPSFVACSIAMITFLRRRADPVLRRVDRVSELIVQEHGFSAVHEQVGHEKAHCAGGGPADRRSDFKIPTRRQDVRSRDADQ